MRIAVAYHPADETIAVQLEAAETLMLYTEDEGVLFKDETQAPVKNPSALTAFFKNQQVNVLLCDNLEDATRDALLESGVAVLAGASGKADEFVVALLENRIEYEDVPEQGGFGCGCGCGCGGDGHGCGGEGHGCGDGHTHGDGEGCGCGCHGDEES